MTSAYRDPADPNPEDLQAFKWPDASNYGKEQRKWNKPYVFQKFPQMLYQARQLPGGKWVTSQPEPPSYGFTNDNDWNRACQGVEVFNRGCQRIVNDETEYKRAHDEGWRDHPITAVEFRESLEKSVADAAAHRHYEDTRLSEKAQAEARVVDESTADHVPSIPEAPRRRRKSKAAA